MSDIEEIRRLHHTYAFTFDRGDFDAFAALFEHGTLHLRGVDDPATGLDRRAPAHRPLRDPLRRHAGDQPPDAQPDRRHRRRRGDGAGDSTYVQVLQGFPDFPPQTIATGIYRDVLRRRDGQWTFAERVTDGSLRGDLSRHLRRRRDRPAV